MLLSQQLNKCSFPSVIHVAPLVLILTLVVVLGVSPPWHLIQYSTSQVINPKLHSHTGNKWVSIFTMFHSAWLVPTPPDLHQFASQIWEWMVAGLLLLGQLHIVILVFHSKKPLDTISFNSPASCMGRDKIRQITKAVSENNHGNFHFQLVLDTSKIYLFQKKTKKNLSY